jgi:hypothetical protein
MVNTAADEAVVAGVEGVEGVEGGCGRASVVMAVVTVVTPTAGYLIWWFRWYGRSGTETARADVTAAPLSSCGFDVPSLASLASLSLVSV